VDFAAAGISTGVAAVAAGGGHACAVLTSGEVACWGRNDKGQLGNKTTIDSDRPVLVQRSTGTLSNIVAVALGAQHSCALSANRNVWCWGDGAEGKLGTPSLENRAFAASVKVNGTAGAANLSNALAIDLGPHHACAIQQQTDSTRKLLCWGRNTQGEHALGESQVTRVISHASLTLSGIDAGNDSVSIANHGLQNGDTAILESSQGSLSAGTIYYIKATSADVFEFHTSTALNSKLDLTGGETGASIKFSSLFASNSHGLTNGTALSIVATSLPSGVSASTVLHVVQASEHFFRLSTSVGGSFLQPTSLGTGLSVMRIYPYPQAFKSSAAVDVTEAAQVVAGSGFTCVLRTNRTVLCAGANTRGATGQGTSGGSAAWATAVKDSTGSGTLGEVVGLAAGANHVCSIMKDRQMQCWGGGTSGQLGASQSADSTLPLPVNTGSRLAFAVAAGYENSCALLRQGTNDTVSCWGSNSDLQLADTLSQSSQTTATTSVRTHAEAIFTPRSRYCSTVYQVTPLP
jgi:alpha-tubulin suppressor-like RCC1 family protein